MKFTELSSLKQTIIANKENLATIFQKIQLSHCRSRNQYFENYYLIIELAQKLKSHKKLNLKTDPPKRK